MQKEFLLPASILVGAAIIALGLFFGLRSGPTPSPGLDAAPSNAIVAGPNQPATPPNDPPGATTASPLQTATPEPIVTSKVAMKQADFERAAKAALAAEKKATFIPKCWTPLLAKQPEPATSKFLLNMTFDAKGVETGRGISEERGASRPDVANCLRLLPLGLKLTPPPGESVQVEIPLELP